MEKRVDLETNLIQLITPYFSKLIHKIIIDEIMVYKTTDSEPKNSNIGTEQIELLTIKQCTELIPGISYYTIRELLNKEKIKSFRTGQGKHGKILVYKHSFLDYFAANGGIA